MGAYYTKEDITEYISKNCIIPYLFDAVKQSLLDYLSPQEVNHNLGFYLLSDNPDRYIYDAVKKGVNLSLPDDIAKGINDVSQRENWNQTADENYALPTEIWREVIARRNRYFEIKEKLTNGEITSINDLITYNLNIRQFAQDVISNINSPLTLKIFYEKLATMSILDPTCGSGAFLFSALNILYPLYSACLERMQEFVEEKDPTQPPLIRGEKEEKVPLSKGEIGGSKKQKKYLEFADGSRSYFPDRIPKTATFKLGENDPYAQLYSAEVVDIISNLNLPRYALGSYQLTTISEKLLTEKEKDLLDSLSRAGRNLIGFCRTNLFKRLESSGYAFIESIERHILRNYIYLYAIESGLDIPIGTQDVDLFSTALNDEDTDSSLSNNLDIDYQNEEQEEDLESLNNPSPLTPLPEVEGNKEAIYQEKARKVYEIYQTKYQKRFKWIRPNLFNQDLITHLRDDAHNLLKILKNSPEWTTKNDQKLLALHQLITKTHPQEKILIFSQFADTVDYLEEKLTELGLTNFACATGKSENPTILAQRFSPKSNNKNFSPEKELRVLIATDVLSEGQNLQDCRIIVNYDLPWAIIRLIQRAGRVDRIGQNAEEILCYSFLPADGVEELINLRGRLINRLQENAEVVGTDEVFFEGGNDNVVLDLYHEKTGILDDVEDNEVDLISEALSIWESAKEKYPDIAKKIEQFPNVIYSTRHNPYFTNIRPPTPNSGKRPPTPNSGGEEKVPKLGDLGAENPHGVLMYMRTSDGVDALAYVDENGNSVTQSQSRILRLARCELETEAIARHPNHFDLVDKGAKIIAQQQKKMAGGGKLGSPNGARAKTYTRLNGYIDYIKNHTPLLAQGQQWDNLIKAVEDIYNYPLKESAIARLNRQLRSGIKDEPLADMVVSLWEDSGLCVTHEDKQVKDSQIICSLGLF